MAFFTFSDSELEKLINKNLGEKLKDLERYRRMANTPAFFNTVLKTKLSDFLEELRQNDISPSGFSTDITEGSLVFEAFNDLILQNQNNKFKDSNDKNNEKNEKRSPEESRKINYSNKFFSNFTLDEKNRIQEDLFNIKDIISYTFQIYSNGEHLSILNMNRGADALEDAFTIDQTKEAKSILSQRQKLKNLIEKKEKIGWGTPVGGTLYKSYIKSKHKFDQDLFDDYLQTAIVSTYQAIDKNFSLNPDDFDINEVHSTIEKYLSFLSDRSGISDSTERKAALQDFLENATEKELTIIQDIQKSLSVYASSYAFMSLSKGDIARQINDVYNRDFTGNKSLSLYEQDFKKAIEILKESNAAVNPKSIADAFMDLQKEKVFAGTMSDETFKKYNPRNIEKYAYDYISSLQNTISVDGTIDGKENEMQISERIADMSIATPEDAYIMKEDSIAEAFCDLRSNPFSLSVAQYCLDHSEIIAETHGNKENMYKKIAKGYFQEKLGFDMKKAEFLMPRFSSLIEEAMKKMTDLSIMTKKQEFLNSERTPLEKIEARKLEKLMDYALNNPGVMDVFNKRIHQKMKEPISNFLTHNQEIDIDLMAQKVIHEINKSIGDDFLQIFNESSRLFTKEMVDVECKARLFLNNEEKYVYVDPFKIESLLQDPIKLKSKEFFQNYFTDIKNIRDSLSSSNAEILKEGMDLLTDRMPNLFTQLEINLPRYDFRDENGNLTALVLDIYDSAIDDKVVPEILNEMNIKAIVGDTNISTDYFRYNGEEVYLQNQKVVIPLNVPIEPQKLPLVNGFLHEFEKKLNEKFPERVVDNSIHDIFCQNINCSSPMALSSAFVRGADTEITITEGKIFDPVDFQDRAVMQDKTSFITCNQAYENVLYGVVDRGLKDEMASLSRFRKHLAQYEAKKDEQDMDIVTFTMGYDPYEKDTLGKKWKDIFNNDRDQFIEKERTLFILEQLHGFSFEEQKPVFVKAYERIQEKLDILAEKYKNKPSAEREVVLRKAAIGYALNKSGLSFEDKKEMYKIATESMYDYVKNETMKPERDHLSKKEDILER